ncbi:MAG: ring-cleaving dioxygenase [Opitutus sp.]|nr:ring-cleaving dioxygenase [Opitutus sp.]
MQLLGLHHITAMAADPSRNLAFYTRVLGLRFVKKSVNQDDPGTYHLYYGNHVGSPGTALTFFPQPSLRRGRPGHGQAYATAFSVPADALTFWQERLVRLKIDHLAAELRFNDQVLTVFDPDGLRLELVFTVETDSRPPAPSADVPAAHAIRGFHSSTIALAASKHLVAPKADAGGSDAAQLNPAATVALLTATMGYRLAAQAGHRSRYTVATGGPGAYVDILTDPGVPRGLDGAGTIHHVAFRVADDAAQCVAHTELTNIGAGVSPVIDRAYFKSIYYREPNGVLFEIATDQPGFTVDEPVETLGTRLSLPPRLEPHRAEIEAALPKLD